LNVGGVKPGALVALVVVGCSYAPGANEVRSEITSAGDTVVVTSTGNPTPVRIDSVEVFWRSPELENPGALVSIGGRLIVADPTRLHILTVAGEYIGSTGREGAGPREFGSITALGRFGPDTVAVHDVRNQRISFYTPAVEYVGSAPVTPAPPFVNPEGSDLIPLRGGVVSLWRENIHSDRPTLTALAWRDLEADTATFLAEWEGEQWTDFGGRMFAPGKLFGPRVVAALAPDGRVAVGNGLDYCVRLRSLTDDGVRKACRVRAPVPVGDGIRDPDMSRLEDGPRREALANVVSGQEIGEHLPSFDLLRFDEGGRLWVRTLGPELADVHPYLRRVMPEREPAHRTWEVFDADGRLVGAVEISSNFEPQVITSGHILGFVELPSGEIALGRAKYDGRSFEARSS
jgi:hypothetical protein